MDEVKMFAIDPIFQTLFQRCKDIFFLATFIIIRNNFVILHRLSRYRGNKFNFNFFNTMKKFLSAFAALFFCLTMAVADGNYVVRGKVVIDLETLEPMVGVTVLEKGTRNGAVTGLDGTFYLKVKGPKSILVFNYLDCESLELEAAFVNRTKAITLFSASEGDVSEK